MVDLKETLKERGEQYGEFKTHAQIAQQLKQVCKENGEFLKDMHREALDMIMHKVARILNGNPDYADSWHDIAGYAQLVADRVGDFPKAVKEG